MQWIRAWPTSRSVCTLTTCSAWCSTARTWLTVAAHRFCTTLVSTTSTVRGATWWLAPSVTTATPRWGWVRKKLAWLFQGLGFVAETRILAEMKIDHRGKNLFREKNRQANFFSMKIKMVDLWTQIEGTKLIFIMNFSVLDFFKFVSRTPQIA